MVVGGCRRHEVYSMLSSFYFSPIDELGRSRYVLCLAATNHISRKSAEHRFYNSKVGRVPTLAAKAKGRSSPCLATAQTTILLSSSMTVRNAVALCSFLYDSCIK